MIKKQKIQSIINCFETGSAKGNYGDVSIFADGLGGVKQITYGRSQTTASSSLDKLIKQYILNKGQYADALKNYKIKQDLTLWKDKVLINILKLAGNDPIMQTTQDEFFDTQYWTPAEKWFLTNGFKENLSMLVIYDSFIHSGGILDFLRKRFPAITPKTGGDEKVWITQYLETRHLWLANHSNKILRKTIYRTADMKRSIAVKDWNLDLTFVSNGLKVI